MNAFRLYISWTQCALKKADDICSNQRSEEIVIVIHPAEQGRLCVFCLNLTRQMVPLSLRTRCFHALVLLSSSALASAMPAA